jgi:hypothetical protein
MDKWAKGMSSRMATHYQKKLLIRISCIILIDDVVAWDNIREGVRSIEKLPGNTFT